MEAAIHAISAEWTEQGRKETEAENTPTEETGEDKGEKYVILVDARNGFNELSRFYHPYGQ